jgi:hypothetical protein
MSFSNKKLNEINNVSSQLCNDEEFPLQHITLREEFDLLNNDKTTINTKKVIFALWNNRTDSESIIELVDLLRYILLLLYI